MSNASVKSLHLKQFSFVDGNSPAKPNVSPKTSSHRKFQATKTVLFPNPEQGSTKPFNFLMNTTSPKIPQIKSPKLAKMTSDFTMVQGRGIKNENNLNDASAQISPAISPSLHGHSSHRVLKSQLQTGKPNVTSYGELQRNLKEFSRKSSAAEQPVELLMLLNKKSEEISRLKKNIKDLSEKTFFISSKNKNPTERVSNFQELQKSMQKKDQMIYAYEKLLGLLTGEEDQNPNKKEMEISKSRQKQRLAMVTENMPFDGRSSQHMRMNSSGNSTTVQRSTNPTLSKISMQSPSLERNDSRSRYNSKITENETSTTSKGDISAFSPPQSSGVKPNTSSTKGADHKMRAIESIYRSKSSKHKSDGKNFLHRSVGPIMNEIVIFDNNLEKIDTHRRDKNISNVETEVGFETQEYPTKSLLKTDSASPLEQNLFSVFSRFEDILKKYEEGRNKMMSRNEEILLKLNQLIEMKNQKEKEER